MSLPTQEKVALPRISVEIFSKGIKEYLPGFFIPPHTK